MTNLTPFTAKTKSTSNSNPINKSRIKIINLDYPELSLDSGNLDQDGVDLEFEDMVSIDGYDYLPVCMEFNILKASNLAGIYKKQIEKSFSVGRYKIQSDCETIGDYLIVNCSLYIDKIIFDGQFPIMPISIGGFYKINKSHK